MIGEIRADIRQVDQINQHELTFLAIHVGYNRFSDKEISLDYFNQYIKFLQQLATIFPPEKIILYLPFIRGTELDQIQTQHSVVKAIQKAAYELGYLVRSLFCLLPIPINPTRKQILKWYSPEKNYHG